MTKAQQARLVAWRLKILKWAQSEPRSVARTCRYFGISRTAYYRWKKRYEEHGEAGLADRSRAPLSHARETSKAVVGKILYLRQNYHFGAGRIQEYLHRFHEIKLARSTVHRILEKNGMGRLPANQKHQPHKKRWIRYEKAKPGHRLQMDVKFLERIPGTRKRLYQFTAIDDCTRIRPRTPRLKGKVERSHRIDNEEFYQLLDDGESVDIHLFNEKLREWEDYNNYHRPHGALQGQTPFERLIEKTRADVSQGS